MLHSCIAGIGSYVPPNVVTNDDLSKLMATSDEWINARTGIRERRHAPEGVSCSDLALEATKKALEDAGLVKSDIDFIILATLSPDHHFPGTACYLQAKLDMDPVGCMDIRNQCTGFLYSLVMADSLIRAGVYKNILVVGSEVHSSALNFTDEGRDVAVLFGDAAAAVVISACDDPSRGVLYSELLAEGKHAGALHLKMFDISQKPYIKKETALDTKIMYPQMDGRTVFKHAVTRLVETASKAMHKNNVLPEDIKFIIPHQANMRINHMVADKLGIPREKFLHNMQKYGNTTAASIPLLLDETYRSGMLQKGDLLMLLAFGAGFTWGSALMRW